MNGGVKEIAIQDKWSRFFCGMSSGCNFWLFKKNKQNYETLLSYGIAFDYKFGKKRRIGFRDLILRGMAESMERDGIFVSLTA